MARGRKRRSVDGILLLDKPLGLSSNQALQAARRIFDADKAGHTGSLDPLASGMLPICFGQATKLSGLLLDSDKCYETTVRLGQSTDTGDAEGEVISESDFSEVTRHDVDRILPEFRGSIEQIPPMYSALKRNGRPLYELARAGETVERQPRALRIASLEMTGFRLPDMDFRVQCSKGTYIRTLGEDMARAMGQCAHLSSLRRISVDPFEGERVWTLDALEALALRGMDELDAVLLPLTAAIPNLPQVALDQSRLEKMAHGQAVEMTSEPGGACDGVAVLDGAGLLHCLARIDQNGRLAPRKWLSSTISA